MCCMRQSSSITSNTLSNAGGVRVNTGQGEAAAQRSRGWGWNSVDLKQWANEKGILTIFFKAKEKQKSKRETVL